VKKQFFPFFTGDPTRGAFPKPGLAAIVCAALGGEGTNSDGYDAASAAVGGSMAGLGKLIKNLDDCFMQLHTAIKTAGSIPMQNLDNAIDRATRELPPMLDKLDRACLGIGCDPGPILSLPPPPSPPPVVITGVGCPGAASSGGAPTGAITSTAVTGAALSAADGLINAGVITGELAAVLPVAIPVVGAVIAVALLLVHFLGHGCGEPCIDAAKGEQIYESAADDIAAAFNHGMLTLKQVVTLLTYIYGAGTQHMATFGTAQANRGARNMQSVITALIAGVQREPVPKPVALNITAAHAWYVSGPGWYPDATAAGGTLADTLLDRLAEMKGL
jgi:hypothetical protein